MKKLRYVENKQTLPLENAGLVVREGWSKEIAAALVAGSREKKMRTNVPRDMNERFIDEQIAHRWFKQNERAIYTLGYAAVGVIWYSRKPRPDLGAKYTVAIRMYEAARGRHLANAFMSAVQQDFEQTKRYEGAIWLETDASNASALHVYQKQGYEINSEANGRITMVRPGSIMRGHLY